MNTIEKRKLEGVVVAELSKAQDGYKSRRERERNELIKKFEDKQTPEVKQLLSDFVSLRDTHNETVKKLQKQIDEAGEKYRKEKSSIEDRIEKQGFRINHSYGGEAPTVRVDYTVEYTGRYNNTPVRKYSIPELVAFEKETTEQLAKLDDYATEFTVSVWSTGEDMAKMLKDFYKGLTSIVA